ncbi:hypothetical protein AGR13a_Lc90131 [Agrobacterium genomosp. 13 str. CFBP 6927]|uniref:Secreted protein n=1 Tax=Agrobacterium genomosp. 13 str. CFBP 6927 TaxID=1183428 RepID=A0ABM9VMX9_9HYPH|nr:hypothetical protein AGR13a_Lc90131 [Agrobacterium genomosp. 13 str. CFBP 6927]
MEWPMKLIFTSSFGVACASWTLGRLRGGSKLANMTPGMLRAIAWHWLTGGRLSVWAKVAPAQVSRPVIASISTRSIMPLP